jgi:hypothetical protein
MRNNLAMTSCSIYLSIDTAINGDGTWGGFVYLRNQVGNITNLLSAAVTQIQIYFPGDNWLADSMQAMQTTNLNIYNNYKTSQLITPNPDTTATALNAGQSTPKVDSLFIKTGMGPNGTNNTMTTIIDAALRRTAKVFFTYNSALKSSLYHHTSSHSSIQLTQHHPQQLTNQPKYPPHVQSTTNCRLLRFQYLRTEIFH